MAEWLQEEPGRALGRRGGAGAKGAAPGHGGPAAERGAGAGGASRRIPSKAAGGVYENYSPRGTSFCGRRRRRSSSGPGQCRVPQRQGAGRDHRGELRHAPPGMRPTRTRSRIRISVQLQRVALLRDMINWCIENPAKGPAPVGG